MTKSLGKRRPKELKHTYPSDYPPGKNWYVTAAWEILDFLNPGVLKDDTRVLLAGMIAAKLAHERARAILIAARGGNKQIAEAIQHEN